MKKALKAAVVLTLAATATAAHATPSTTFWTPATTYVQPYAVPHLTYDTYVANSGLLQPDYGLTIGFLPFETIQGEVGIDYFAPGLPLPSGARSSDTDNIYLNAKLGIPENLGSPYMPAVSAGIMSVGFKENYSNYNHLHAEISKTLPVVGSVTVGGYYGLNDKLYVSSSGKTERSGFMAAYTSPDIKIGATGLDHVNFFADYASGNNAFGAWGAGIGIYFTPSIDILTGPVFFNDSTLFKNTYGSDWLWSVQLDVDFDLRSPPKK